MAFQPLVTQFRLRRVWAFRDERSEQRKLMLLYLRWISAAAGPRLHVSSFTIQSQNPANSGDADSEEVGDLIALHPL